MSGLSARPGAAGPLAPEAIVRLEGSRAGGPAVVVLDQRRLPGERVELACTSAAEVAEAIRTLAVRGAPAIGVAAAYGMALAAARGEDLAAARAVLAASRPTAVNLFWALAQMDAWTGDPAERARQIHLEEVERCEAMAEHALELFPAGCRVLTHCNAGGLATGGVGTAVGAIVRAWQEGLVAHVLTDETRPLLQGARLTAFELEAAGVPFHVQPDSAAALALARGEVDLVVVGADRIARNGDAANKIGTYMLGVLAKHHGIPLVVVAPSSTVDLAMADGSTIPIEERDGSEVTARFPARNPAFDVTPHELIAAIVTERGVHRPPFDLAAILAASAGASPSTGTAAAGAPAAPIVPEPAHGATSAATLSTGASS